MECNFQIYDSETNIILGSDGWNVSLIVSENVIPVRRLGKRYVNFQRVWTKHTIEF